MRITVDDLELTEFTPADTRELYAVRNHPSVRTGMANPDPIPFRSHKEWVRANLIEKRDPLLFMIRRTESARAIGLTQLRIQGDTGEIGVMFRDPWKHRLPATYATVITLHLAFSRLHLSWIISYVIPGHAKAIAFNQAWGGVEVESDRPGLRKLRLAADTCLDNSAYRKVFQRIGTRLRISE